MDLLPHRTSGLVLESDDEGGYRGRLSETHAAGSYTIKLQARGTTRAGRTFQRVRLFSVLAGDRD